MLTFLDRRSLILSFITLWKSVRDNYHYGGDENTYLRRLEVQRVDLRLKIYLIYALLPHLVEVEGVIYDGILGAHFRHDELQLQLIRA